MHRSLHTSTHAERPEKFQRQSEGSDEAKLHFRFADSMLTQNTTGAASLSVGESGSNENRLEVYGATGALMVEETGELWHSPAGSGAWRPVAVDQDPMATGMRPGSWSRGFTAFSGADY
jgi:predicted dehydrogenase